MFISQVNLSPGLVEANVGEPHLLRGKNWSEREEVRIIVTIMMTIFKRGGEEDGAPVTIMMIIFLMTTIASIGTQR